MKRILFVLIIAVAFISCEKQEQSHVLIYDMQEYVDSGETVTIETRLMSFRTDNDNVNAIVMKYEQEPVDTLINGFPGIQWIEARVFDAAPRY